MMLRFAQMMLHFVQMIYPTPAQAGVGMRVVTDKEALLSEEGIGCGANSKASLREVAKRRERNE